jgi:hypothetical protein
MLLSPGSGVSAEGRWSTHMASLEAWVPLIGVPPLLASLGRAAEAEGRPVARLQGAPHWKDRQEEKDSGCSWAG